jgi:tetratricopeptide (TPR) repeat protein
MKRFAAGLSLLALVAGPSLAQTQKAATDKADAYYHYSLGHLYSDLASTYSNRSEYLNQAIDHYRDAMKADPSARFLADELADLYIQSGRLNEGAREAEAAVKQNPRDVNSRRILGRIYSRLIGDTRNNSVNGEMVKRAIEQYTRIAEAEPKDVDAWLMLGRLQKVNQDSIESQKAFNKALEIDPENQEALSGLALVYSDLGDHTRAAEVLKKVAERNPDLRTLVSLAASYEQLRDFASASDAYRKAVELSPGNDELKRALGQSLIYAGKLDEAASVYQQLIEADANDVESHLRLAQIYRDQRDFAKAREAVNKAKAAEPNNLEIMLTEALLLKEEGRETEAIANLKTILDATSKRNYTQSERVNRGRLMEQLGEMHLAIDQYPEAVAIYRQVAELDPNGRTSALMIEALRLNREFNQALQEADAAVKKYPQERYLLVARSSVLSDMGRADEAVAEVKKLFDGKNDRGIWVSLAQTHSKSRNFGEMAKDLDEAEKLSKTDDEKETVFLLRGEMFEKMKRIPDAEAEFRKALAISPNSPGALNYIGYMLADRNIRLSEAVQLISKALEQDPYNGAYLDSLGWAYYRMARYEEAESTLVRAAERTKRDPTVHDHLGDTYLERGKVADAVAQWESSLQLWQQSAPAEIDHEEMAKIQKKIDDARSRQQRQ